LLLFLPIHPFTVFIFFVLSFSHSPIHLLTNSPCCFSPITHSPIHRLYIQEQALKTGMEISIKLPIKIRKKGSWFLASCSSLDVVTQGETQEQAKKNIGEALYLFFRSCIERGTLDAVLKQCGFTSISESIGEMEPDEEQINVPLYLLSGLSDSDHCRA
jgi:predicted RNase H-like HicB family nuclease